jgi:hypothetical protein
MTFPSPAEGTHTMTRFAASGLLLSMILLGCSGTPRDANKDGVADGVVTPNSVSQVVPTTPTGNVSGQVVTAQFAPLDGATVTLTLGAKSATAANTYTANTDASGNFAFQSVPATAGELTITKAGYTTVHLEVSVPNSAGNFPLDNGNANVGVVGLFALTGAVKLNVVGANGAPAKGVHGLMNVAPAGFVAGTFGTTFGSIIGGTSAQATADDNGQLSFSGLPDIAELASLSTQVTAAYTVTISSFDADGDGRADSYGTTRQYSATDLFTGAEPNTIVLPDARPTTGLGLLATNVGSMTGATEPSHNAVSGATPLYFVFNQPIIETSLKVTVVGEDCATAFAIAAPVVHNGNSVIVTPTATWSPGAKYNVIVRAAAAGGATTQPLMPFIGYVFGFDPTAPVAISPSALFQFKKVTGNTDTSKLQQGDHLYVVFNTLVRAVQSSNAGVFFNLDLYGNGSTGGTNNTDACEYGSTNGCTMSMAEPSVDATATTPAFVCMSSGWTSHYEISVGGVVPANGIAVNTDVKVTFTKTLSTLYGYDNLWGDGIVGDVTGKLTLAP